MVKKNLGYQISVDLGYDVRDFGNDAKDISKFIGITRPEIYPFTNILDISLNPNQAIFCYCLEKKPCEELKFELESKNFAKEVYINELK